MLNKKLSKGFTLIELLVVIALIGVLAAGVIVTINPLAKINSANLAKVKTFSKSVENSISAAQVGKWSFEEANGAGVITTATDTSGYGNTDGSPQNLNQQQDCVFGKCAIFNGSSSYSSILTMKGLSTSQLTFSFWSKQSGTSNTSHMHPIGIFGGHRATVYVVPNGLSGSNGYVYKCKFQNIGGINYDSISLGKLDSNWHHIVVTFNGTNIKGYIDGVLWVTQAIMSAPAEISAVDQSVFIGNTGSASGPAANWFNGLIDEVQLYSQALTASNVQQLYAQGLLKHAIAYVDSK